MAFSFRLWLFSVLILQLVNIVWPYPIATKQIPIQDETSDHVYCESIDTYSTEWFLQNTRPEYRHEIHHKALFYTRGISQQARRLACQSDSYVTIWDIWPKWLYDNDERPNNKLRCIHNDRDLATRFYENMSRAYGRMARQHATVMHSFDDYTTPPLEGIWGRIELPAISQYTDISEMVKINEDRSLSDLFRVPHKAAPALVTKAIQEVRDLLRQARSGFTGMAHGIGGSCSIWQPGPEGFLDDLF